MHIFENKRLNMFKISIKDSTLTKDELESFEMAVIKINLPYMSKYDFGNIKIELYNNFANDMENIALKLVNGQSAIFELSVFDEKRFVRASNTFECSELKMKLDDYDYSSAELARIYIDGKVEKFKSNDMIEE